MQKKDERGFSKSMKEALDSIEEIREKYEKPRSRRRDRLADYRNRSVGESL